MEVFLFRCRSDVYPLSLHAPFLDIYNNYCVSFLTFINSAFATAKDYLYSPEEIERLELDRVPVEVQDGYGYTENRNPMWPSSLIGRLLGNGSSRGDHTLSRSSSGVSLKNWFGGSIGGYEDDGGYAVAVSLGD